MAQHKTNCWLVNTGWVGGAYGSGERIKLSYTRRIIEAALSGELNSANYKKHPTFGFEMPQEISGIPANLLDPRESWPNKAEYDTQAQNLADRFELNYKKFETTR